MNRFVPLLALPVFIFQVGLVETINPPLVNAHESVETYEDVTKLYSVMEKLDVQLIVLHEIPEDFLKYHEDEEIDLSELGDNPNVLQQAVLSYPDEFNFVCSIDPEDTDRMTRLEDCISQGAIGVKWYSGYSVSHTHALDDSGLDAFLSAMEQADLFLTLPVNSSIYGDELINMLDTHPDLEVICPHYCLSSSNLAWLDETMNAHSNLYVDTSFGSTDLIEDGFLRMTIHHDEFVEFFENHADRILFATNNVITSYEGKSEEWVAKLYSDYISMLTDGVFQSQLSEGNTYLGLDLPYWVQEKVFWRNWESLLR